MKVHIAVKKDGWILERIAQGFADNVQSVTVGEFPWLQADLNFFIPYTNYRKPSDAIDAVLFTHRREDEGWAKVWDKAADMADYCVAMSNYAAESLPPEKTIVIEPGIDKQFFSKPPVFGVIGSGHYSERKGMDILREIRHIEGIKVLFTNGNYDFEDMRAVYEKCDYILIVSRKEGGPMCVPEALAMHKPVIAPDVGWCWEYPVIRYDGITQLTNIIKNIIRSSNPEHISYKSMSDKLMDLFTRLISNAPRIPQGNAPR